MDGRMTMEKRSIAEILGKEFDKRNFITDMNMDAEQLFQSDQLKKWIIKLLENDETSELVQRIESASPERLVHAVATYLLGIAVREELNLNFDFLPRIFSKGSYGDAFYFFWSVICLCHDFGYQYETGAYDRSLMDTHDGRCTLLGIEYDMFELEMELDDFDATSQEKEWIIQAVDLAKKYDRMRRNADDNVGDSSKIDHGIAGALILYDFLMKEYHAMYQEKNHPETGRYRDPKSAVEEVVSSGEVSANVHNKRFPICTLLIACTVARHNVWMADQKTSECYQRYGLDFLCQPQAIVSAENSLDQMLYMLDFMDTIDPVKAIYTREAERRADDQVLENRRRLLLSGLELEFSKKSEHQYRWESALRYQKFTISIKNTEGRENKEIFNNYADSLKGFNKWLKTESPSFEEDSEGFISGITLYYPNIPRKQRQWIGGITEDEISALCLYEGSGGNGKSSLFYQYHNAYQTLNLIMMDGLKGEQARICEEGQNPSAIYIREWKRSLEVMTDIFTAQCKFMEYWDKKGAKMPSISRVDREVNFNMMKGQKRTFAFTSTSKRGYLKNIAKSKKNRILQKIVLTEKVPFIDYAELLQETYVYSDEQEVLLPPFLKLCNVKKCHESGAEVPNQIDVDQGEEIPEYMITFGGFDILDEQEDEMALIQRLEKYKEDAVKVLENIKKNRKIVMNDQTQHYLKWKESFQALVRHCFFNIGTAYGLDK